MYSRGIFGPDVHQVLLARELIKHDFEISIVTYAGKRCLPCIELIKGIEVIKVPALNKLLKIINIWKAMEMAKADIYYNHSGAGEIIPFFCRLHGKMYVYHIASDSVVNLQLEGIKFRWKFFAWWNTKLADIILVQSKFQKAMLKKNFGKDSRLIKNHFPLISEEMPVKKIPPIVLWVGSMSSIKKPKIFIKLAKAIPEARFQLVGGVGDGITYYDRIKTLSSNIPNLDFLGLIPFDEINKYFRYASILVNTSIFEGFPYAFIQAWMNYTPVVSFNADPDEIICKYKLGFHSRKFHQLVKDVNLLLGDAQLRRRMGENGRRYVEKEHNITEIINQYIDVFARVEPSTRAH